MPAKLALLLCTGFVLFLLWLERKQSPNVSRALWIPTVWMLYAAGKPLAVWFPSSGATPESSPLDRAFLLLLMVWALWLLSKRRFSWSKAVNENAVLIALVVFMLVSVFWSSIPLTSFFRWIREIQAIIIAFTVLSEVSPRQAMESILRRTTYILVPYSILLIKYFPEYGIEYGRWTGVRMWIGVSQQKNGLGILCFISAFFIIWSIGRRWKTKRVSVWKYEIHTEILVLTLAFWLMGGEERNIFTSATSFYALLTGLLFYVGFKLAKKSVVNIRAGTIVAIATLIILLGVIALFTGGANISFAASPVGRDSNLTGRSEIWASILPVAMRQPFLGHGFGGFWTPATKKIFGSGAHSGYLDVLLELGFAGIFVLWLFFIKSGQKAHRELSCEIEWGILNVCYIYMILVHNITESSINSFTTHQGAIILFLTIISTKTTSLEL